MSECKSEILIYNIPLKVITKWKKVLLCKKSPLSMTLRPCFIIVILFSKVLSKLLYYPWTTKNKENKQTIVKWKNLSLIPYQSIIMSFICFLTYKSVTSISCTQCFHTHFSTHSDLTSFLYVFQKCFPLFSISDFIIQVHWIFIV